MSSHLEADHIFFQGNTEDVITSKCGTVLDHGVLAVGYGHNFAAGDFFIVNSSWGVLIYVNINAGASNVCIIISAASYQTE